MDTILSNLDARVNQITVTSHSPSLGAQCVPLYNDVGLGHVSEFGQWIWVDKMWAEELNVCLQFGLVSYALVVTRERACPGTAAPSTWTPEWDTQS